MKKALKEREAGKLQLSVIRMARSAIKNRSIELGRELTDEDVIEVLAKEVKMRREALAEYRRAGRQEAVAELEAEIAILEKYLPRQLDRNEIVQMAREAIAATGAQSERDLGKVMGVLMPKLKGRADGKLVNEVVREILKDGQR
ncbi:aspartyl/glutamyl-tRNA amidotransferase, subunit B [Thermacetogenium phaeum DSM 12270]|uniref:Aspartyl/glutamyl-tRNA amidotransferase, subunit B n=2 Tax=Thermacetogenium phaeum TaxID=85874 RepID=K4LK67_THEPS|nr:aspartyl/glutamyl-tRNA amidotransferase, subunit B [Thermacetogenium phaeum DSM 12270]